MHTNMYMHNFTVDVKALFIFSSCTCSVVIPYCNVGRMNIDLCQNNLCWTK